MAGGFAATEEQRAADVPGKGVQGDTSHARCLAGVALHCSYVEPQV
jgi:hypothetical protein